jgi:DNA polymerase-1
MDINSFIDLHSFTASLILEKNPEKVTPNERKKYKSISLGYFYGMGAGGIVFRTGLQRGLVKKITETLDQKFKVLRSKIVEFEKEAKEKGYAETPWGRKMNKDAKYGYWALLAQATAADYFKYILVQVSEKLPDLILSAPLFDGCLYKIKSDQQKLENIMGDIIEITTQQVEGFCKMAVDIGSGESWQGAVRNAVTADTQ